MMNLGIDYIPFMVCVEYHFLAYIYQFLPFLPLTQVHWLW